MKILQINSVCGTGSTGRIVTNLCKVIRQNGHECKIAYGRDSAPIDINTIKIGNKLDIYLHVITNRLFDKHGLGSVKASLDLVRQIKEYDPDIVHLHNIHGYYINIEILFNYLKDSGKNTVWTLHDCWAFTGHCSYFDIAKCSQWESGCKKCPNKRQYPKSLFIDNSRNNYLRKKQIFNSVNKLTIITPSNWLSNLVNKSFLKKHESQTIYHGIDLATFSPKCNNKFRDKYNLNNKFVILGVANIWDERKGYKYFIELSKMIKDDSVIVLVGLDKKKINDLPHNIIAIERTNNIEELAEIYSVVDVFFNPTLEEMFGLVNIESIACGTPVVSFNTGGCPECIDESSGFVIQKGDLDAALSTFDKIRSGDISSEKCIERAKLFNKEDKYLEYINLYKRLKNN